MVPLLSEVPIPHEHGPESLDAVLQRTTRIPLYCHPKHWSDIHLDALRVQGLEKTYPLDHVIGRPVACDPSDTDLREAIDEITRPFEYNKRTPGRRCYLDANLNFYLCNVEEDIYSSTRNEGYASGVCCSWVEDIRDHVRKYPCLELDHRFGRITTPDTTLYLHYGKQSLALKSLSVVADYPDYEGYPSTFFPVMATMCRNHDDYRPREDLRRELEAKRVRRWRQASKPAEMIASLIAMAQQQAKRLVIDKSEGNRCGQAAITPVLLWVDGSDVRFVRAHVPITYLEALSDPSKCLIEPLTVEMTSPLDLLKESDRPKLLISLTALLDEYFQKFRPMNLIRSVPILSGATGLGDEVDGKSKNGDEPTQTTFTKLLRTAKAQGTSIKDLERKENTILLRSGLTATT